jgi:anti-sigma regulatory factor (Ser/Thr protein kinase)
LPTGVLLERIRAEATEFSGNVCFADDFTCVAVKVRAREGTPLSTLSTEFPASINQLAAVRDWLSEAAGSMPAPGLDEDRLNALHLALTEAFSNCVVHGTAGAEAPIGATALLFPRHISITLRQYGKPFAPANVPPPAFDGSREGGFGVYIISRSVDELSYSRDENGFNSITLLKLVSDKDGQL